MKFQYSKLISLFIIFSPMAISQIKIITLDDALKKSLNSFEVEQVQIRLEQTALQVKLSKRSLLPKLNLIRAVTAIIEPIALIDVLVEDLVPFLFPQNWIEVKKNKLLHEAMQEGSMALNQTQKVKVVSLYAALLQERNLYSLYEEMNAYSNSLYELALKKKNWGAIDLKEFFEIEKFYLNIKKDFLTVSQSYKEQKRNFASLLRENLSSDFNLVDITNPYLELPNVEDYLNVIEKKSHQLKQYSFLIEAAKKLKKKQYFSILGSSSVASIDTGSVFGASVNQDGLGFGQRSAVEISKKNIEILNLQKEMQFVALETNARNYYSAIEQVAELQKTNELLLKNAVNQSDILQRRMSFGDDVRLIDLLGSRLNKSLAQLGKKNTDLNYYKYNFLLACYINQTTYCPEEAEQGK